MAFAITSGNFSNPAIWDTGVVPTGSEGAYSNNFTIQVDTSITPNILANTANPYYLPNTAIPVMTSATSPSGIVTASSQVSGNEGWRAFDRNLTTLWQTVSGITSATLAYQFPSNKIIKKYSFRASGATAAPRNFTFEAFDGASWITLDTQTAINVGANGIFTSALVNAGNITYSSYRINVTTVNGGTTIQITEFEMTESTSSAVGNTASGTFALSTPDTTVTVNSIIGGATNLIVANATSGTTTLNVTNNIGGTLLANTNVVNHSGVCNLVINCPNIIGGRAGSSNISNTVAIQKSSTSTLTVNGNISAGTSNGGTGNHGINSTAGDIVIVGVVSSPTTVGNTNGSSAINQSAGKLTISGNVLGGSQTTAAPAISSASPSNLEITGTVVGGVLGVAINKTSGAIIVTGNVVASTVQGIIGTPTSILVIGNVGSYPTPSGLVSAIAITNTATIEVTGFVAANSTSAAITALGLVSVNGLIYNIQQWQGVFAPRILIGSATTSILYQNFSGSSQLMYAGTASVSGQPTTNNVRFGTPFGVDSTFVGTCRIPTPNTVRLGAATDNTTGTLIMTPDEFIEELGVSTRPIAVRLQNVSTVETTGDQVASYGV